MATLRIDNVTIIPMDGPPDAPLGRVRPTSIRVRGDRITELGELQATPDEPATKEPATKEPATKETVLDGSDLVALPGFVQAHVHFCQTLFRGLADDLPLLEWLRTRIWPLEAAHNVASLRASAQLSILELLRGGTTTVQVMESVRHTESSFEVARQSGMTVILGNCLMDLGGPGVSAGMTTSVAGAMRICEELRTAFDGVGRLHYAVSPRFILSCSDELSRAAAAFAIEHNLRVHTHACEHQEEINEVRARLGADYIVALQSQGLLGPRTGLAHCVHTSAAERRVMLETGAAVLHCPSANLKLGSGLAPIADYADLGLRIGLGADGAPCNNRLSALTELRQAALLQSAHAGPGRWSAERALVAATRGGAEALGLQDDLGSLEVGKRADITLMDLTELEPGGDELSRLVYSATDAHVKHVVLGGELVVRDGVHTQLDPAAVRRQACTARTALLARAGL